MPENVMLWGPTASGKTMLIWGLARDIQRYSTSDEKFVYSLQQLFRLTPMDPPTRVPVLDIVRKEINFPEGNQGLSDKEFEFKRTPTSRSGLKPAIMEQHNFTHNISVRDIKGGDYTAFFDDPTMDYLEQAYIYSRNIIAVFDIAFGADNDPEKMRSDFERFFEFLRQNHPFGKQKRNLAICLTKVDMHKLSAFGDPKEIFDMTYGEELYQRIMELKEENKNYFNLEFFATSAVGYIYDPETNTTKPNTNGEGDYFQKEGSDWRPINAAAPFFWIFEMIERETWAANGLSLKKYISYPTNNGFFK